MIPTQEILYRLDGLRSPDKLLTDEERELLRRDLNERICSIRKCASAGESEQEMLELGELQSFMATLAFKHAIQLSARQREIVREYDRYDDPTVRFDVFRRIKSGEFPWGIE